MGKSKRFREARSKYDREQIYALDQAVAVVKDLATARFDETVEMAIKLNMKRSHSVRDTFVLPNSFQREQRILVFAKAEKADEATNAGATHVGDQDLIDKIRGGWLDFDVAVATPDMMKDVGRLGPILGRRGLMPNPKTRTVTNDIAAAVAELRKGRVEFRADKTGVVHLPVGKASMETDKIIENARSLLSEVRRKRPSDIKGEFLMSAVVSSTMGPGVRVLAKEVRSR